MCDSAHRAHRLAGILAGLAIALLLSPACFALTADFTWTMPARTVEICYPTNSQDDVQLIPTGRDTDGDFQSDQFGADLPQAIKDQINPPDGWHVDLDPTASAPTSADTPIVRYEWFCMGQSRCGYSDIVGTTYPEAPIFGCSVPREGTYRFYLTVYDSAGHSSVALRDVVVQDWLIVAMGDSYTSGEGNPDIGYDDTVLIGTPECPIPEGRHILGDPTAAMVYWQDFRAHRSGLGWPAQVARILEEKDPRTSVTLVHVGTSGATVTEGLIGPFVGAEKPSGCDESCPGACCMPPQVEQIRELVGDREIDALVFSIGINDLQFGPMVECCLWDLDCHRDETDIRGPGCAYAKWHRAIAGHWDGCPDCPSLAEKYDMLAAALDDLPTLAPGRTYFIEYPNPCRDENGEICNLYGGILSSAEMAWAESTVLTSLNGTASAAASEHGWTFVDNVEGDPDIPATDTIYGRFERHGYCSSDRWFRTGEESLLQVQGDERGTFHPNETGHRKVAEIVASRVAADLYTDPYSVREDPRWPGQHPTAVPGGPQGEQTLTVAEGASLQLANDSSDPEGGDLYYMWMFQGLSPTDGASYCDPAANPVCAWSPYEAPALWGVDDASGNLLLSVTDCQGLSDSESLPLTVTNQPPVVQVPDVVVNEGDPDAGVEFTFADPGVLDTHTAQIAWGDGTSQSLGAVTSPHSETHAYPGDDGDYAVTVTVTDDDGASASAEGSVQVANVPPSVAATGDAVDEGESAAVSFEFSDPGTADTHTGQIAWGDGAVEDLGAVTAGSPTSRTHAYPDSATYAVAVTVTDDDGGQGVGNCSVEVRNVPPAVTAQGDSIGEGETATVSVQFTDPGADDTHTAQVDWGDGAVEDLGSVTGGSDIVCTHGYPEDGAYAVAVTVTDDEGGAGVGNCAVSVANLPAAVGPITAPTAPLSVGTLAGASASFADPGVLDTHTALWDWGDGATSPGAVTESDGAGSVTGSHTYTAAGLWTVRLTVTDDDGADGESVFQYVIVYDPEAGFVTGAGWFDSPAGAYVADPTATGRATFAFACKYRRDDTTPMARTQFNFSLGGVRFLSASYEWLAVSGSSAWLGGSGALNAGGDYGFLISAVDGDSDGGSGPDRLRVRIWNKGDGTVVYDNMPGAPDAAPAAGEIGAGQIAIH